MTRKDYILIAKSLNTKLQMHRQLACNEEFASGYGSAVESVALALKSDNPRFDEDRFLKAVLGD